MLSSYINVWLSALRVQTRDADLSNYRHDFKTPISYDACKGRPNNIDWH